MNSQFTNSNFGRVLYVAIITLIVAATIFVIWYMLTGYKIGTYAPDTRLASVYIGGITEDEVSPRVEDKINYWYGDETIVFELNYQGYSYEFDRNLFLFDLETSIYNIEDGVINQILVYYQGTDRGAVETQLMELPFLSNIKDNVDFELLINDLLYDASFMKSFSIKHVEDYLIEQDLTIVKLGESDFIIPEGITVQSLISKVETIYPDGKIVIEDKELFDITEVFGNIMNDAELSILASAMLSTILDTNFLINEVHYKPVIDFDEYTIDDYYYYARNTHVNKIVDEGFSFYNPNDIDYYFMISEDPSLTGFVSLYGLDFEYVIDVEIVKTELPYITQFTSETALHQLGFEGVIIEVNRVITDIDDNVIYDDMILFEFYPPIKEIAQP